MNSNDSRKIAHYYEAERLLRLAGSITAQSQRIQPGAPEQEILERRVTHVEQQAQTHALLAGIDLPPHTEPPAPEADQ